MDELPISIDAAVSFLEAAAKDYAHRPTKGEDSAHWANVYNAENCRRIAVLLETLRTPTGADHD